MTRRDYTRTSFYWQGIFLHQEQTKKKWLEREIKFTQIFLTLGLRRNKLKQMFIAGPLGWSRKLDRKPYRSAAPNIKSTLMNDEIKFDLLLDAKGLGCPLPILKTKKALESLDGNQILRVETTDPASKKDMASWAQRTGNELLRIDELSGTFVFYIRKRATREQ